MKTPIVCGIDPSICGTAICHGTEAKPLAVERFPSDSEGKLVNARIGRLVELMERITMHLDDIRPDVIVIEHYSFGSRNGGEHLGEWGGILRWHLLDYTGHVFEVPPASLKKFITGKGNAPKDQMGSHVALRWQTTLPTNDHVDAFALYQLGLVLVGRVEATNTAQREVVEKVLAGRPVVHDVSRPPF